MEYILRILILDYIYHGEVQIYQEHLNSFLEVAQKLKIEGLIKGAEHTPTADFKHEDIQDEDLDHTAAIATARNIEDAEYDEKKVGGVRLKSQARPEKTLAVTVNDNSAADEAIQEFLVREEGVYSCKVCNFSRKIKQDVTRHIETHIEGVSYSCSVCGKTSRSRNSLRKHKSHFHKV